MSRPATAVALVKEMYERINGHDADGALELVSSDFAYHARPELPGSGTYDRTDSRERLVALFEIFDELRFEPEEFIDAGDLVVVCIRESGRGRFSGAPVEEAIAHLWRVEDGRIRELRVYSQRADALRAAGLS